jgi:hypothetical protein
MNERIQALAEQAGAVKVWEWASDDVLDTKNMDAEKFAELIVKECAEQIKTQGISASSEDYGDYEIGFNAGLFHALRTTKEHFGVES